MDTIYWSAAYMAHAALNHWLASSPPPSPNSKPDQQPSSMDKSRHIIFTSSTLAFFPLAGYAPYTPAKAAMRSLSDTLVQEVAMYNTQYNLKHPASSSSKPTDIKIHTLFPMGILTPGYDNENKLKPPLTLMLEKDDKPQHPDEVARIAVERLEKGDYLITTMFLGHLLRGMGMGASVRNGVMDLFWSGVGGLAVWFVVPDFVRKCRSWGRENGDESRK
jgi:3-dehydrosphinganine reductase